MQVCDCCGQPLTTESVREGTWDCCDFECLEVLKESLAFVREQQEGGKYESNPLLP